MTHHSHQESDPTPTPHSPQDNTSKYITVFVFYLVLVGIAESVGPIWDVEPIKPYYEGPFPLWLDGLIGLAIGLFIVGVSRLAERVWPAYKRLSEEFSSILGPMTVFGAFFFAFCSGIGEEIFFRGFLQQLFDTVLFRHVENGDWYAIGLSSFLFGIVHTGPKIKVFYPWTLFALVVGVIFGILYWLTGSIFAPVIAHFAVNFINLSYLTDDSR